MAIFFGCSRTQRIREIPPMHNARGPGLPLFSAVDSCEVHLGHVGRTALPLKNTTCLNFLGNMGYMSVKDENIPRAQGVLRGK